MRRRTRHSFLVLSILALLGAVPVTAWTDDAPAATPHRAKNPPRHVRARASAGESEAARREREHREDLERRVERLEQRYEMKDGNTSPPEPAR